MIYRKGVFVAVYRKEKEKILYLLLRRKLHWNGLEFPKGGIEKGESLIGAVKREVKEETGMKAFNIKSYKISGKYKYDKKYKDRPGISGQTWKLFSAEVGNKKIKIDRKEHAGYKWLEFKRALNLLTWKNQKRCLRVVNRYLN